MSTATLQHPAPTAADDFDPRAEGQRLIKEWYAQLETANARNAAVANVFVMGNAVEILRAFDFQLVFPEINSLQTGVRKASEEYIRLSEDYGMSPDVCSYVKADVGLILKENEHPAGRIPKASLAVASNMCGTFIKWAEIWERWLKTPTFVLDLPGQRAAGWQVRPGDAQHAADARWVEAQFQELIAQCERITGKRFDMDKLAEVEARVNKMVDHWNNVMALNRQCPAPFNAMLDGLTYIGIMNVHRGPRRASSSCAGSKSTSRPRSAAARAGWPRSASACSSPARRATSRCVAWSSCSRPGAASSLLRLPHLRRRRHGRHRPALRHLAAAGEPAEVTALAAQRGLSNHFFAHERLAQQIKDYAVDGVVFHGIKSCRFVSSGMADTREFINKRLDVPTLYIESDLIDPRYWSDAQIKNRVDAFFEALHQRGGGAPLASKTVAA